MQPEHLRYILGLKVKRRRQALGLGLKEIASEAGLSVSYLSEIEKGRKYPKPEKLLGLSSALGMPFDELVSLKLDRDLGPVEALVRSRFLQDFPFELFGLRSEDLLDLVAGEPERAAALLRTVAEVGQTYDVRVEHFLSAALRSLQQMRGNHFEEIETAADDFREAHGLTAETVDEGILRALLETRYGYVIDSERLADDPDLSALRSVRVPDSSPNFFINGRLRPAQRAFAYGRELGYVALGDRERSMTSSPVEVVSFDQVINDFRAAYFAGAVLMPRRRFVDRLEAFFAEPTWSEAGFLDLFRAYPVTPETFLYRLTQVAPSAFGLGELYFMRFAHRAGSGNYVLTKNLNMSRVPVPHGVGLGEHYCRRWPGLSVLGDVRAGGRPEEVEVAVERSHFASVGASFFVLTLARPLALADGAGTSISVGFLIDDAFRMRVAFADDPAIPDQDVGLTCERCAIDACRERVAPPELLEAETRRHAQERALEALLDEVDSR